MNRNSVAFRTSIYVVIVVAFLFIPLVSFLFTVEGSTEPGNSCAVWHFDEGSGAVANDSSGNQNHGKIVKAGWGEGVFGSGLEMDGKKEYVKVSDSDTLDPSESLTIATWVKLDGGKNSPYIVDKKKAYSLQLTPLKKGEGYRLKATLWLNGRPTKLRIKDRDDALEEDTWHHIALTYDGKTMKFYLDGELQVQRKAKGCFKESSSDLFIGKASGRHKKRSHLDGALDDMVLLDYALCAEELSQLKDGTFWSSRLHVGDGYEYETIQDALANTGDEAFLYVHPGAYSGNVEIGGKNIVLLTDGEGIQLSGFISVSDEGTLEIRNSLIYFDPETSGEFGVVACDAATLFITGSKLTKFGDIPWRGVTTYEETTLLIENSVLEHAQGILFSGKAAALRDSRFQYLGLGLFGSLCGTEAPILENIVSSHNTYGLLSRDDLDWTITGSETSIKDNTYDVGIMSSGSIYIPFATYETSLIRRGATGVVIDL